MEFKTAAILGVTGMVGQELLSIMNADTSFQFEKLFVYSSSQTSQQIVEYKGHKIPVSPFDENNIPDIDILFSSVDENLSKKIVPEFLKKGAYVIDDSSAFRLDKKCAMVVVGINDNLIRVSQKLYAQPNCVVIGIVYPLFLIMSKYRVKKVYVSTYQSITGAGKKAFREFTENLNNYINTKEIRLEVFKNDPILNAIPVIPDSVEAGGGKILKGFTYEEEKIALEVKRMLNTDIDIIATAVRVSVEVGHSASIFLEVQGRPLRIEALFKNSPYIEFEKNAIYTPKQARGKNKVYICRLRTYKNTICFWATWDNLRIGSALNMWNIFKKLLTQ